MRAIFIATVIEYDTKKYRLLSMPKNITDDKLTVLDVTKSQIIYVLKHKQLDIVNLSLSGDRIVGSNGRIERYPRIEDGSLSNKALTILGRLVRGDSVYGYVLSDYNGRVLPIQLDKAIEYAKKLGISNGKLVTKDDGTEYISAINGNFEEYELANKPIVYNENNFEYYRDKPLSIDRFKILMNKHGYSVTFGTRKNKDNIESIDSRLTDLYIPDGCILNGGDYSNVRVVYASVLSYKSNYELLQSLPNITDIYIKDNNRNRFSLGFKGNVKVHISNNIESIEWYMCELSNESLVGNLGSYESINSLNNSFVECKIGSIGDMGRVYSIERSFNNCNTADQKLVLPAELTSISNSFKSTGLRELDFSLACNINTIAQSILKMDEIEELDLSMLSKIKVLHGSICECTKLKRLKLPNNLSDIGYSCIKDLDSLEHLELPSTLECLTYSAISDIENLKELNLSNTKLMFIGDYAIYKLPNLNKLMLPNTVKHIGSAALNYTGLTELDLSHLYQLEGIGYGAISNLPNLTTLKLPPNLNYLNNHSLSSLPNLTSIELPASLDHIGDSAFSDVGISELKLNCTCVRSCGIKNQNMSIILGDNSHTVEARAFNKTKCNVLDLNKVNHIGTCGISYSVVKSLLVSPELSYVGHDAFSGTYIESAFDMSMCTKLKLIGLGAFRGVNANAVVLPDSIEGIGNLAFEGAKIGKLYLPGSILDIGNNLFKSINPNVTIYTQLKSKIGKYCKKYGFRIVDVSNVDEALEAMGIKLSDKSVRDISKIRMLLGSHPQYSELLDEKYSDRSRLLYNMHIALNKHINAPDIMIDEDKLIPLGKRIDINDFFTSAQMGLIDDYEVFEYSGDDKDEYTSDNVSGNSRFNVLANYIMEMSTSRNELATLDKLQAAFRSWDRDCRRYFKCLARTKDRMILHVNFVKSTIEYEKEMNAGILMIIIDDKLSYLTIVRSEDLFEKQKLGVNKVVPIEDIFGINELLPVSYNEDMSKVMPRFISNDAVRVAGDQLMVVGSDAVRSRGRGKSVGITYVLSLQTGKIIKLNALIVNNMDRLTSLKGATVLEVLDVESLSDDDKEILCLDNNETNFGIDNLVMRLSHHDLMEELKAMPNAYSNNCTSFEWRLSDYLQKLPSRSVDKLELKVINAVLDSKFFVKQRINRKKLNLDNQICYLLSNGSMMLTYPFRGMKFKGLDNILGKPPRYLTIVVSDSKLMVDCYISHYRVDEIIDFIASIKIDGIINPNDRYVDNNVCSISDFWVLKYYNNIGAFRDYSGVGAVRYCDGAIDIAIHRKTGEVFLVFIKTDLSNRLSYTFENVGVEPVELDEYDNVIGVPKLYKLLRFKSLDAAIRLNKYLTDTGHTASMISNCISLIEGVANVTTSTSSTNGIDRVFLSIRNAIIKGYPDNFIFTDKDMNTIYSLLAKQRAK